MGRASVGNRWAVFAGSNGNGKTIEIFDAYSGSWFFGKHNLSLGREQAMGAGTDTMYVLNNEDLPTGRRPYRRTLSPTAHWPTVTSYSQPHYFQFSSVQFQSSVQLKFS